MSDKKQIVMDAFNGVIYYARSHVGASEGMSVYKKNEKDAITLKHYILNSIDPAEAIEKLEGLKYTGIKHGKMPPWEAHENGNKIIFNAGLEAAQKILKGESE